MIRSTSRLGENETRDLLKMWSTHIHKNSQYDWNDSTDRVMGSFLLPCVRPLIFITAVLILRCASQSTTTERPDDKEECPMFTIQRDILKATINFPEADSRTLVILVREVMEEKYGGKWGVVIVDNPRAVDTSFHWNIPIANYQGKPAYCVGTYQNRTYNVFKTDEQ